MRCYFLADNMTKNQNGIMSALEVNGHYILADAVRQVLADKATRRKSKIEAINLAAGIRDNIEAITYKLLQKKAGSGVKDVAELLEADFDRLEDKIAKILTEYLEYKSNQENVPEQEQTQEQPGINQAPPEFEKKEAPKPEQKRFKEPKIIKEPNTEV